MYTEEELDFGSLRTKDGFLVEMRMSLEDEKKNFLDFGLLLFGFREEQQQDIKLAKTIRIHYCSNWMLRT